MANTLMNPEASSAIRDTTRTSNHQGLWIKIFRQLQARCLRHVVRRIYRVSSRAHQRLHARILLLIPPLMVPGRQGFVSRTGGYGVRDHQARGRSSWWLWRSGALVPAHQSGVNGDVRTASKCSNPGGQHRPLICTNDRKRPRCTSFGPRCSRAMIRLHPYSVENTPSDYRKGTPRG